MAIQQDRGGVVPAWSIQELAGVVEPIAGTPWITPVGLASGGIWKPPQGLAGNSYPTGNNTYTGLTQVGSGVLQVGGGGSSASRGSPTYAIAVIRTIDGLSPRLQAAMAAGEILPYVNIQTPSGKTVTVSTAVIVGIGNAVRKGSQANSGATPLQAVRFILTRILVDQVAQNFAFVNWTALNQ
jgi:hypothetical protein